MLLFFNQELLQLDVRSSDNPNEFQHRGFHLALLRWTAEKVLVKTSFTITTSFVAFKSRGCPPSYRYRSTHIPTSKQFIKSPIKISYPSMVTMTNLICQNPHQRCIYTSSYLYYKKSENYFKGRTCYYEHL